MQRKKKAALDVSINSIVVIVFAITMLGLGLAFIKGKFGELEEKVTFPTPSVPASAGQPIVLPSDTLLVKRGTSNKVTVNFYNDESSGTSVTSKPIIDGACTGEAPGQTASFILQAADQTVPLGQSRSYETTLSVGQIQSGKYICNMKVHDTAKQFIIEVK